MALKNLLLGPLYLMIVFFIAAQLKKRLVKEKLEEEYYYKVLFAKFFGVTFFAFIYHFYYGGGDSIGYYVWAEQFSSYLFKNFGNALSFLISNSEEAFYHFKYSSNGGNYNWIFKYDTREAAMIKITSIVNLLGLNSYMSTSYIFALISFVCNWLFYRVFAENFPTIKKQLLWATLLIPSVLFWGGGIMKDTISFCGICLLVYTVHQFFVVGNKRFRNGFFILLSAYIIIQMKAYVLLAFLPAGALWIFGELKDKIKQKALRVVATPLFYLGAIGLFFLLITVLGEQFGRFSVSSLDQTVKDYQSWHKVASEGGSGYDLNITDASLSSMLAAFPKAVNVTLFRPYLWEASNPVVLMAAIESTFFMFLFLMILIKSRIIYFIRYLFSEPIIQMCLVYSLFLGFAVGFTSYNFGALVRYKIPLMPFFTSFLVVCWFKIDAYRKGINLKKDLKNQSS